MPVEIDENELASLRSTKRLMEELLSSKTKKATHESIKLHHPEYQIPIDAEETRAEAKRQAEDVLAAHLKKENLERLEREFASKIDSYRLSERNPDGYTDEGIEKIKNLMRDKTIPDVDAAVALFEKLHPPKSEPPSGYVPTGWNFSAKGDDNKKLLFEDPDAWSDQEAKKVWEEYRTKGDAV